VECFIRCPQCHRSSHIMLVWASTDRCPGCLTPLMAPHREASWVSASSEQHPRVTYDRSTWWRKKRALKRLVRTSARDR